MFIKPPHKNLWSDIWLARISSHSVVCLLTFLMVYKCFKTWCIFTYGRKYPKGNQSWIFSARTDAETETPVFWPPDAKNWLFWKDPDAGKNWRREEKGMDDRGWDDWMVSPTQWTWVWVSSGRWWWTGKSGVLQSMGSQRVGHDWVTEQQLK